MHIINGYIIACTSGGKTTLYGAAAEGSCFSSVRMEPWAPFEETGLRPFRTSVDAFSAKKSFEHKDRVVDVYRFKMEVVENDVDLGHMKHKRSLVVLQGDRSNPNVQRLIGSRVPGQPQVFDGVAYFTENGFATFTSYVDARYAAGEIARQSQSTVRIANIVDFIRIHTPRRFL